jgi:hypothetical protein
LRPSFSCERENAQAACLPIRPMALSFNAPVPRKLAEAIRLKSARNPQAQGVLAATAAPMPMAGQQRAPSSARLPKRPPTRWSCPSDFKDASGRTLRNADNFPLKVATGGMPPLAKFAARRLAWWSGLPKPDGVALLPVTLRNVEAGACAGACSGHCQPQARRQGQHAQAPHRRRHHCLVPQGGALRQLVVRRASRRAKDVKGPLPKVLDRREGLRAVAHAVAAGRPGRGVKTLDMPKPAGSDPRPFEVVGIPLAPGFHVVEIASQKLGASLLDARHGEARTMYVRTSALVTNLGVHFKLGRENAVAWVTTLDKGQPVPGARCGCHDCRGKRTGQRRDRRAGRGPASKGLSPRRPPARRGRRRGRQRLFRQRPRHRGARAWRTWPSPGATGQRGIEPWRFNVPTSNATSASRGAPTRCLTARCCARAKRCR